MLNIGVQQRGLLFVFAALIFLLSGYFYSIVHGDSEMLELGTAARAWVTASVLACFFPLDYLVKKDTVSFVARDRWLIRTRSLPATGYTHVAEQEGAMRAG